MVAEVLNPEKVTYKMKKYNYLLEEEEFDVYANVDIISNGTTKLGLFSTQKKAIKFILDKMNNSGYKNNDGSKFVMTLDKFGRKERDNELILGFSLREFKITKMLLQ